MGGTFTQVKSVQCPGLAHLLSDGSVDTAYCYSGLTGSVKSLTRVANGVSKVLVVGGDFTYRRPPEPDVHRPGHAGRSGATWPVATRTAR